MLTTSCDCADHKLQDKSPEIKQSWVFAQVEATNSGTSACFTMMLRLRKMQVLYCRNMSTSNLRTWCISKALLAEPEREAATLRDVDCPTPK